MSNTLTSTIIGKLVRDNHFPDWWKSEKIAIPFFDMEQLPITFIDLEPEQDKTFIENADLVLTNFFTLRQKDRESISHLIYKSEKLEATLHLQNENEIWNHIYPSQIYISRRPEDQQIYVQVGCGCDWNEEHGLQLVFKQGHELSRISEIDGHLTDEDANTESEDIHKLLSEL